MSEVVLSARDLHKSYGPRRALEGVSLQLQRGQRLALLGPNGAGKSTLLQLLTGLFVPDQGEITVLGHDMRRAAPLALAGIGVVFQQAALDLDLSVQANLRFHTDLHGLPARLAEERVTQGLQDLGLADERQRRCRELSGGTRRKVELLRAMLHRPAVLLMDEATVGLDPASRQTLLQAVRALQRSQGVAVLWATHLVEEIDGADGVLVLHQGRVRHQGTVDSLLSETGADSLQAAFLALTRAK